MDSSPQGILLDIEGTTSSISFVYDVLFPYARRELRSFLETQCHALSDLTTLDACEQIARECGLGSTWTTGSVETAILGLMDRDIKSTPLKTIQGQIWRGGFESGQLRAHVYEDVPPALRDWTERGIDLRIYSSGSIEAQQLFFKHTIAGDLTKFLRGNYDTTTGPKRDAASYEKIAAAFAKEPPALLFISDVVAELDAALSAGYQTVLALRPGNAPAKPGHGHREIRSFAEITF